MRLSYCTVCMGRLHHLQLTLRTNLQAQRGLPVEWVLLDYNSGDGLGTWLHGEFRWEIREGLLAYYHTREPTRFNPSHAKNVAHTLATGDILCNLDADNFASRPFTEYLLRLFAENERIVTHGSGPDGFFGRVALSRTSFIDLGGYDERLGSRWGFEDSDLVNRGAVSGLKVVEIPREYGQVVIHSDIERTERMATPVEARLESLESNAQLSAAAIRDGRITANAGGPWGRAHVRKNFLQVIAVESGSTRVLASPEFHQAAIAATEERLSSASFSQEEALQTIIGTVFDYHRIGFDRRLMEFEPDGTVGRGMAGCEVYWRFRPHGGAAWLDILSRNALTCRLKREPTNVWRGRWENFERMPIELTPVQARNAPGPPGYPDQRSIRIIMLSCPERAEIRAATLRHWENTDMGEVAVHCQMDAGLFERRQDRIEQTGILALEAGLRSGADFVLLLEDDLEFNLHLRHNLSCWQPLINQTVTYASLYTPPGIRVWRGDREKHFSIVDPETVYGGQAILLSREAVQYALEHWHSGGIVGMPDARLPRLAARMGQPLHFHMPSLVQHVGQASVWGGWFHEARNFRRDWKSPNKDGTNQRPCRLVTS